MSNKNDPGLSEKLDRIGRYIVGASILTEEDASAAASTPFLFKRVRACIVKEREEREAGSLPASLWQVAQRAIPAMGLAAAVSFGVYLYANGDKSANAPFSVDVYLGTNESGIESLVFAERRPLTHEEVLTAIVSREEREAAR